MTLVATVLGVWVVILALAWSNERRYARALERVIRDHVADLERDASSRP